MGPLLRQSEYSKVPCVAVGLPGVATQTPAAGRVGPCGSRRSRAAPSSIGRLPALGDGRGPAWTDCCTHGLPGNHRLMGKRRATHVLALLAASLRERSWAPRLRRRAATLACLLPRARPP